MSALDDLDNSLTEIGTAVEGLAADILDLKNNSDPARIEAISARAKTIADAAKAADAQHPTIPPGTLK